MADWFKYGVIFMFVLLMTAGFANYFNISGFTTTAACDKSITENVRLGANLTSEFSDIIDRDDLCLFDGQVSVQGDDSDTREVLVLGQKGKFIGPATALTSNEDYGGVMLEVSDASIKFYYVFDNTIDLTKVSLDSPLEITFLGKPLSIVSVSNRQFSALAGESHLLKAGVSVQVNGKLVTLMRVSNSGAIVIDVDGVSGIISKGGTESINGLQVTNRESFYDENLFENLAEISVGKQSLITASDARPYIGENESGWAWNIGDLASKSGTTTATEKEFSGAYIGIENTFDYDDENALSVERCVNLPDSYLQICFEGITSEKYISLDVDVETTDLSEAGGSSETTTHFSASKNMRVGGTSSAELWVTSSNNIYYYNNGIKSAGSGTDIATIEDLKITKSGSTFTLVSPVASDNIAFSFSGSELSTAAWNGRSIVNADGKLITRHGVVVDADSDISFEIPRDRVEAIINITSLAK